MKVVINACFGGFGLSKAAEARLKELGGSLRRLKRNDPILVRVVEELGDEASDSLARLKVIKIPNGVKWQIEEYDGFEWVAEKHRTWRY